MKIIVGILSSHLRVLFIVPFRFFDWIFTKYFEERNLEVRSLLMKAIYYVSACVSRLTYRELRLQTLILFLQMLQTDKDHVLADFACVSCIFVCILFSIM